MEFNTRTPEKDLLIKNLINQYIKQYQSQPQEIELNKKYKQLYDETQNLINTKCKEEIDKLNELSKYINQNKNSKPTIEKGKENEIKKALESFELCKLQYSIPLNKTNEFNSFANGIFIKQLNICLDNCDKSNSSNYEECYKQCFDNGFKYTHCSIVYSINILIDEMLLNIKKL
jgi:hypothetical protein